METVKWLYRDMRQGIEEFPSVVAIPLFVAIWGVELVGGFLGLVLETDFNAATWIRPLLIVGMVFLVGSKRGPWIRNQRYVALFGIASFFAMIGSQFVIYMTADSWQAARLTLEFMVIGDLLAFLSKARNWMHIQHRLRSVSS